MSHIVDCPAAAAAAVAVDWMLAADKCRQRILMQVTTDPSM